MYNFDGVCGKIRDVIEKALKDDMSRENNPCYNPNSEILGEANAAPEDVNISFTDYGLAFEIKGELYGITIDRV